MVPVEYIDLQRQSNATWDNDSEKLDVVVNDPGFEGSTYNLYQEMSYGQLHPARHRAVGGHRHGRPSPSYAPGLRLHDARPDRPVRRRRVPRRHARRGAGHHRLARRSTRASGRLVPAARRRPSTTAATGRSSPRRPSAIDGACGPLGKSVFDAAQIADPEIDYNQYDSDKDGVVDFFMLVFVGCGGNGGSQVGPVFCPYFADQPVVRQHLAALVLARGPVHGRGHGPPGLHQRRPAQEPRRGSAVLDGRRRTCSTRTAPRAAAPAVTTCPVYVRVGPYNVNPETVFQAASVISHEYGHHLGLPDFYNNDGVVYADMNLMAVRLQPAHDGLRQAGPRLGRARLPPARRVRDRRRLAGDQGRHRRDPLAAAGRHAVHALGRQRRPEHPQRPGVRPEAAGRQILIDPGQVPPGEQRLVVRPRATTSAARRPAATTSTSSCPSWPPCPRGRRSPLEFQSSWDIEWDWDYGFVLTGTNDAELHEPAVRERLHDRQGLQPQQDRLPDRARQRPHRHERRLAAGRAVRDGRAGAERQRLLARRAVHRRQLRHQRAGRPGRRPASASATSPTAPSTGPAGSSTTSSSKRGGEVIYSSEDEVRQPGRDGCSPTAGAPSPPRRIRARPTTPTTSSCATSPASTSAVTARRIAATRAGSRASSSSTPTRPTATATAATWSRRPSTTSTRSRSPAATASSTRTATAPTPRSPPRAGDSHFDDFVDADQPGGFINNFADAGQRVRRQPAGTSTTAA